MNLSTTEKVLVIIKEAGYLGMAVGGRVGHDEWMYCTDTRDTSALKEEVKRYLRNVGYKVDGLEIIIRDARGGKSAR